LSISCPFIRWLLGSVSAVAYGEKSAARGTPGTATGTVALPFSERALLGGQPGLEGGAAVAAAGTGAERVVSGGGTANGLSRGGRKAKGDWTAAGVLAPRRGALANLLRAGTPARLARIAIPKLFAGVVVFKSSSTSDEGGLFRRGQRGVGLGQEALVERDAEIDDLPAGGVRLEQGENASSLLANSPAALRNAA